MFTRYFFAFIVICSRKHWDFSEGVFFDKLETFPRSLLRPSDDLEKAKRTIILNLNKNLYFIHTHINRALIQSNTIPYNRKCSHTIEHAPIQSNTPSYNRILTH